MPAITTPEYSLPSFDTKLDGKKNNYRRRRWRSLCFHLVCSSVCLTVWLSVSVWLSVCRIVDEFLRIFGEVGCITSISSLDFDGDIAQDAKTEIKKCHFGIEALQRILLIIQERIIMKCAGGVECLTSNKPFDWCWFGSRSGWVKEDLFPFPIVRMLQYQLQWRRPAVSECFRCSKVNAASCHI